METLNKKGYMLSIEAVLGILILFLFIYYIVPQRVAEVEPKNIELIQNAVLDEVSTNLALREDILDGQSDHQLIIEALNNLLASRYNYLFIIKNTGEFPSSLIDLAILPTDKQVYAKSIVVSATIENIGPKTFYFYLWEK